MVAFALSSQPLSSSSPRLPQLLPSPPTQNRQGFSSGTATFQDILSRLNQFQAPRPPTTGTLSPEIQGALDLISTQQREAEARAASNAQALAGRRGLAGSSIEQFGVAQGTAEASKPFLEQRTKLLLDQAARDQQSQDLFAQLQNQRDIAAANLTSDEVASLRNIELANQQLALERALGERALQIQQENIGISAELARKQAETELLGSGISALAPFLLGGGFGGGGGAGGLSGLFGGGNTVLGRLFGGGASDVLVGRGTGQFVPGIGNVGTGVGPLSNFAGLGSLLGGAGLGFLGGSLVGTDPRFQKGSRVGSVLGGIGGTLFGGPLGALLGGAAGSAIGASGHKALSGVQKSIGKSASNAIESVAAPFVNPKKTVKTISKSIKKVFPF